MIALDEADALAIGRGGFHSAAVAGAGRRSRRRSRRLESNTPGPVMRRFGQ